MSAAWLTRAWGLGRSLAMYYGQPWRNRRRRDFYAQLIAPGSLCFDIGAHVGNRIGTWLALGARVVAVEPQPDFLRFLQLLYGERPEVTLRSCAVAREGGERTLHVSEATPTVSTLSQEWVSEVQRDERFRGVEWRRTLTVQVETLDSLIARHGVPSFCKVDVEGLELEVLQGLTQPLQGLSFEFIPVTAERAVACVERLRVLGDYRFRASMAESMTWAHPEWLDAVQMVQWLRERPLSGGSGDVYARQRT